MQSRGHHHIVMLPGARFAREVALPCIAAFVWLMPLACAQEAPTEIERRVKAAFLYKFTGYVEWPEGTFLRAEDPMTIGIMGDDQLAADAAQIVAGRTIGGRPLAVRRISSVEQAAGVHILFVGHAEAPRFAQIVKALPAAPMLIVSESEGLLRQGSIINFLLIDNRVRFDVSLEAAERRGIRLSSRLLAVANSVQGAPQ